MSVEVVGSFTPGASEEADPHPVNATTRTTHIASCFIALTVGRCLPGTKPTQVTSNEAHRSMSRVAAGTRAGQSLSGATNEQRDMIDERKPGLEDELVTLRHRAELAELERDQLRERMEDMRLAMRMLRPGSRSRSWQSRWQRWRRRHR